MQKPNQNEWNKFCREYIDTESDTSNVKGDFAKLSRMCAVPYFEFLKCQWIVSKDIMSEENFCIMNGNVPIKFFEKNIKNCEQEFEIITKEY